MDFKLNLSNGFKTDMGAVRLAIVQTVEIIVFSESTPHTKTESILSNSILTFSNCFLSRFFEKSAIGIRENIICSGYLYT